MSKKGRAEIKANIRLCVGVKHEFHHYIDQTIIYKYFLRIAATLLYDGPCKSDTAIKLKGRAHDMNVNGP